MILLAPLSPRELQQVAEARSIKQRRNPKSLRVSRCDDWLPIFQMQLNELPEHGCVHEWLITSE